jgi:hypothetical protein
VSALDIEQALHHQVPLAEALIRAGRDAYELMRQHKMAAAETAVQLATILAHAEATCRVPFWPLFAERIGTSEHGVQELQAIHRLGLDAHAVVDLGGVRAAGEWARRQRLPRPGEALTVTLDAWRQDRPHPIVCIWPVANGHCVGYLPAHDAEAGEVVTLNPIGEERLVWQHLWPCLGFDYRLLSMACPKEPAARVAEVLEEERQAMLRAEVDELFDELVGHQD